ncbi:MAG TPA: DMT family transporter [Candidatus Sulfotelmatobacter sp.]|jgi:drug/metabolite transporter (DMT)-like permease|nr:DMT family transporter [Candidatus Sulfotelmatobacter sp.]
MLAIIFAFIVFLVWGVGDIFTTTASRKMGSYNASFYNYLVGGIFGAFYIPFALNSLKDFSLPMILLSAFLAVTQLIAFFSYNEGLKIGNSSLVGTIAGSFTAIVVILSVLFLKEKLFMQQVFSIMIIFIGLFLSSINISDLRNSKSIINKGTIYALIAMVGWAIDFTFIKIPVQKVGFFWPTFVADIVGSLVFFVFGIKRIKMPKLSYRSGFPAVLLSGLLLTIGTFSYSFAIDQGLSSIVASIAGAYPALFALLAYFIFKDPISHQQKFGMVVTLCGIILLAYFSG